MRSQKRVRHIGKVRSLKNAAAGKWKIYRKHLEARKAWQKNAISTGHQYSSYILPPPPPKHRKIREPKQRSPEELRERQRLREQRRLEKKLAKQRASTSTLPESRKEKKLKEASSNALQKVSTEQKTAAGTIKSKNLMTKETAKTKRLMNKQVQYPMNMAQQRRAVRKIDKLKAKKVWELQNEPESKHRCLKDEKAVLADEPKIKPTSPTKTEQKESMKSEKATKDQSEVCLSTRKAEGSRKEQKKKRNRRPNEDNFVPEHDAVEGETHEMNSVEVNADFTEIVGRRHKKKGKPLNEQQSKFGEFAVKAPNENGKTAGNPALSLKFEKNQDVVVTAFGLDVDGKYRKELLPKDNMTGSQISEQQNQQLSSERGSVTSKRVDRLACHRTESENEIQPSVGLSESSEDKHVLDKENLQRGKSETEEIWRTQSDQVDQRNNAEWERIIDKKKSIRRNSRHEPNEDVLNEFIVEEAVENVKESDVEVIDASVHLEKSLSKETVTPIREDQNGAVASSEFTTGKVMGDIPVSTGKVKNSESLPGVDVKMKVCVPEELHMNVAKLPDEQLKLLDVANLNLKDTVTKAKKEKHEVNVEKKEPTVLTLQRDKLSYVQSPRERVYKLLPRDVQFCVHMIEKHGEDYEAMAKDKGNVFRDSVKGIARKIRIFKESPQYEAYLKQKDE